MVIAPKYIESLYTMVWVRRGVWNGFVLTVVLWHRKPVNGACF